MAGHATRDARYAVAKTRSNALAPSLLVARPVRVSLKRRFLSGSQAGSPPHFATKFLASCARRVAPKVVQSAGVGIEKSRPVTMELRDVAVLLSLRHPTIKGRVTTIA